MSQSATYSEEEIRRLIKWHDRMALMIGMNEHDREFHRKAVNTLRSITPVSETPPVAEEVTWLLDKISNRLYEHSDADRACAIVNRLAGRASTPSAIGTTTAAPYVQAMDPAYLRHALHAISLGSGAFSRDPLQHATNCIENMQAIAKDALNGDYRPDDE